MRQHTRAPLLCLLLAALLLTACRGEPPVEQPTGYTVTLGNVTLEGPIKRAVTLAPGLTETVFSLGYGGRIVAVGESSDQPHAAGELPVCGNARLPDVEAMLALSTQLVITPMALPREATAQLEAGGAAVLVVEYADDLDGIYRNYGTLCRAFEGDEPGALREEQLRYYGDGLLAYLTETSANGLSDQPQSAVWLRHLPLVMATGDTMEGRWLTEMGYDNPADDHTGWVYPVEAEGDLNPDVILCDVGIDAEALREHSYYMNTAAVKQDAIFYVDGNVFERQSPILFSELERVAAALQPEAFAEAQRPAPAPPYTPPPPPEKSWFEQLKDKLGLS